MRIFDVGDTFVVTLEGLEERLYKCVRRNDFVSE